ncbi:DUF899 family protein [Streptomyces chiangmaiensis]
MAVIGGARDMNKWSSLLRAAGTNRRFPGESSEYRSARDELLKAEAELRRLNEEVSAQRRALPSGASSRRTTSSRPRVAAVRYGSPSCSHRARTYWLYTA